MLKCSVERRHIIDSADLVSFIPVSPGVSCSDWPHTHTPGRHTAHGIAVGYGVIHFISWSRVPVCCQKLAVTKPRVHYGCQPCCLNTSLLVYTVWPKMNRGRHFEPRRGSPGFRSAIDWNLTQSQRPARVAGEPLFLVNSVRISRAALNELRVRLDSSGRLWFSLQGGKV